MGIVSIILGVVSFLFIFGGFILSVVPVVGTLLSFGAPVLSLVGIVLGGIALSRSKRDGDSTGAATAGLILNIIAFIPGVLVAITCGLCNACMTAGMMNPNSQFRFMDGGIYAPYDPSSVPDFDALDAGAFAPPSDPLDPSATPTDPLDPSAPPDPTAAPAPTAAPNPTGAPAPALPPPPMADPPPTPAP